MTNCKVVIKLSFFFSPPGVPKWIEMAAKQPNIRLSSKYSHGSVTARGEISIPSTEILATGAKTPFHLQIINSFDFWLQRNHCWTSRICRTMLNAKILKSIFFRHLKKVERSYNYSSFEAMLPKTIDFPDLKLFFTEKPILFCCWCFQ